MKKMTRLAMGLTLVLALSAFAATINSEAKMHKFSTVVEKEQKARKGIGVIKGIEAIRTGGCRGACSSW